MYNKPNYDLIKIIVLLKKKKKKHKHGPSAESVFLFSLYFQSLRTNTPSVSSPPVLERRGEFPVKIAEVGEVRGGRVKILNPGAPKLSGAIHTFLFFFSFASVNSTAKYPDVLRVLPVVFLFGFDSC